MLQLEKKNYIKRNMNENLWGFQQCVGECLHEILEKIISSSNTYPLIWLIYHEAFVVFCVGKEKTSVKLTK